MNLNYDFTEEELAKIKALYLKEMSCSEVKERLKLPHTPRAIQRQVKRMGIARSQTQAVAIARKRGRYIIKCTCPKCGYVFKKGN